MQWPSKLESRGTKCACVDGMMEFRYFHVCQNKDSID